MDHPEFITLLLTNGKTIAYVTRWRQAQNESERDEITQEILADPSIDGISISHSDFFVYMVSFNISALRYL